MSGTIIVAVIVEMIFTIGLGLAILTIHNELVRFMAAQNRINRSNDEERSRIDGRIDLLDEAQAKMERSIAMTDGDVRFMSKHVADTNAAMAEINKKTKGTADEQEFLRIKTQALITLPNQIARLDSILTGRPYLARVEKRDGMIVTRYIPDDDVRKKFEGKEDTPDA